MTLFRARVWGTPDWALISINVPGDEEDENGLVSLIASVIGSALGTSSLHIQRMAEDGEWEDVE